MPRKIAMVGTAPSRIGAPVDDPTWEIWGVSDRGNLRADRWFELHPIEQSFEKHGEADAWRKRLSAFMVDIPELYMFFPEPELAPGKVKAYPTEHIKSRPWYDGEHMTSTFSWMMALAIDELAPIVNGRPSLAEEGAAIGIWGVDMEAGTEYSEQRKGFKAMISVAKALGIDVRRVLSGGLIYDPVPYPFWQLDPMISKLDLRLRESRAEHAKKMNLVTEVREGIWKTRGALDELGRVALAPDKNLGERRMELEDRLKSLETTSANLSREIVAYEAVKDEQEWWRGYLMG